jgi:tripartite-type tricarboxylate transporter receptor subunit TctC
MFLRCLMPASVLIGCLIPSGPVCAQGYPSKLIRIITVEPGGGTDFAARLFANAISGGIGQQVIVENRGGASGRLRALVITSAQPSEVFPGLLTISASGLPGYESVASYGFFAPARTPDAVITRFNQEVLRALENSDVRGRFLAAGIEPVGSSPVEFAATIKSDMAKWGKIIRDAGIRTE